VRRRALVVEDDTATRELLGQLLDGEGWEVDVAPDGEKAIGLLVNVEYDLVLLDIVLPRISGADVMEHLLCTKPRVLEKIIVVTGLGLAEVRKLFPTVTTVLGKPVIPNRLLSLIRERDTKSERRTSVA
jgi:DNA-binding response OmpR family regulator